MKAGGIDAGLRIARGDLARGDVGRGIHGKLKRNRQFRQVDLIALEHHFVPGGLRYDFGRNVFLAALAKGGRQVFDRGAEAARQKLAIAGNVGDDGHVEACDLLEDHDRALVQAIELEHGRRHFELLADLLLDPQHIGRIVLFGLLDKSAQALIVCRHAGLPFYLLRFLLIILYDKLARGCLKFQQPAQTVMRPAPRREP